MNTKKPTHSRTHNQPVHSNVATWGCENCTVVFFMQEIGRPSVNKCFEAGLKGAGLNQGAGEKGMTDCQMFRSFLKFFLLVPIFRVFCFFLVWEPFRETFAIRNAHSDTGCDAGGGNMEAEFREQRAREAARPEEEPGCLSQSPL